MTFDDQAGAAPTVFPVPVAAEPVFNPAGLPALSYRIGTHADVLERSLAALRRSLPALTVQRTDDPAVALLDIWAMVADVVTFYQERIANEGFLRTATERRSVLELARAIGYELAPGLVAATVLAFTVEDAADDSAQVLVPAGTRVQSIPGQGELPQTFETDEEITAFAAHNALRLRLRRPQRIAAGALLLRLTGPATGLRPGDPLLIRAADTGGTGGEGAEPPWQVRFLTAVEPQPPDPAGQPPSTVVRWAQPLEFGGTVEAYAFRQRAAIFGHNAPDWRLMPQQVRDAYLAARAGDTAPAGEEAGQAGGRRAAAAEVAQWPGFELDDPADGDGESVIELDAAYPHLLPGSWLLLRAPAPAGTGPVQALCQVLSAEASAAADFGLTSTTTRVRLRGPGRVSGFDRRTTAVYTQSEPLPLADAPIVEPVNGPDLLLDQPAGLSPGATVVVTGSTPDGRPVAETAVIESAAADQGGTRLVLAAPLARPLDPASVQVLGNVVTATAGETTADEVLGSGDGGAVHQRFTLLRKDLAHTTAPGAGGVHDSLEVRVDQVAWTEAGSLYPLGPHDRGYVVHIADDSTVTVLFGDGEHGARLPSGQDNVHARYRSGTGPGGNVRAGTLTLLTTRPLGIRGVTNPLPAAGGTAPQHLEDARAAAPLSVRTLGRVVSLADHEDFARTFAGIAKAAAVALPGSPAPYVHLSLAGPRGAVVPDRTLVELGSALESAGPPGGRPQLAGYRRLDFTIGVLVLPAPDRQYAAVAAAVRDALCTAYSFDRRALAQSVAASEVVCLVQQVPGVVAVSVTALHLATEPARAADGLTARPARLAPSGPLPAELLLSGPDLITVRELVP